MNLKPEVMVNGIEWRLFSIDYQTPDGKFSAYFYAIDAEHASYILEEIKAVGEVGVLA
jgi:hypothetical protein